MEEDKTPVAVECAMLFYCSSSYLRGCLHLIVFHVLPLELGRFWPFFIVMVMSYSVEYVYIKSFARGFIGL